MPAESGRSKCVKIWRILASTPNAKDNSSNMAENDYKTYMCLICGFIYDEALGLPDHGIAPGTRWEDVPEDFECPDCGISKFDFDLMEG